MLLALVETHEMLILAGGVGSVVAVINGGFRLLDRMYARKGETREKRDATSICRAAECKFDFIRMTEGQARLETQLASLAASTQRLANAVETEHLISTERHTALLLRVGEIVSP